jgi:hypothetical protein
MKLADWIRETGLTRTQVARQLGISQGHLTDLCNGRFWPGRRLAVKIWKLTDGAVTPNDFLSDEIL